MGTSGPDWRALRGADPLTLSASKRLVSVLLYGHHQSVTHRRSQDRNLTSHFACARVVADSSQHSFDTLIKDSVNVTTGRDSSRSAGPSTN